MSYKCDWCYQNFEMLLPVIMPNLNEGAIDVCINCYNKQFLSKALKQNSEQHSEQHSAIDWKKRSFEL